VWEGGESEAVHFIHAQALVGAAPAVPAGMGRLGMAWLLEAGAASPAKQREGEEAGGEGEAGSERHRPASRYSGGGACCSSGRAGGLSAPAGLWFLSVGGSFLHREPGCCGRIPCDAQQRKVGASMVLILPPLGNYFGGAGLRGGGCLASGTQGCLGLNPVQPCSLPLDAALDVRHARHALQGPRPSCSCAASPRRPGPFWPSPRSS
jgi:hypothetical protein